MSYPYPPGYTNPVEDFFNSYQSFTYNRSADSSAAEWKRLCREMGWKRDRHNHDNPERNRAWEGYQDALAQLFNQTYGTDAESLEAWQELCRTLRVYPVPDVLEQAREASNFDVSPVLLPSGNERTAGCLQQTRQPR
ncbi:hypothetical protein NMY22_g11006 [Coprinellus aureogranulatus]|nr:hypothetical protein NMY22_g11006 [Coprinellus aureogranulatus]